MFIAIHTPSDRLVDGAEVMDPESRYTPDDSYHCLLCNREAVFSKESDPHRMFLHPQGDPKNCFSRPQSSNVHQLGCECSIKTACNQLGYDRDSVQIESEITKGDGSMVADVYIKDPEPVVFEIYYRSRIAALHRKLSVILGAGKSCHVICVVPGKYTPAHSPDKFDSALRSYGPVEVGRFVPEFNHLTVGTRITKNKVDLKRTSEAGGFGYIL